MKIKPDKISKNNNFQLSFLENTLRKVAIVLSFLIIYFFFIKLMFL